MSCVYCLFVLELFSLYVDFNEKDHVALDLLPVVIVLGHSNSAVNPLLYWLMTRRLHRARSTIRRRLPGVLAKPTPVTGAADCVTLQLLGDVTAGHDSHQRVIDVESLDATDGNLVRTDGVADVRHELPG